MSKAEIQTSKVTSPTKCSIIQRLRIYLELSVKVTTATQLVWLMGKGPNLPSPHNSRAIKVLIN